MLFSQLEQLLRNSYFDLNFFAVRCAAKPLGCAMKIFFAAALLFSLTSCSSTNELSPQIQREDGLPAWAGEMFSDPRGLWDGYNDKKGFYASGESKNFDRQTATSVAELDAKTNLLLYVQSLQKNGKKITSLRGCRRVDRYIADDGSVYILVFVSEKDVKKSARN